jgi:ribosomal protein L11 methyltransferase
VNSRSAGLRSPRRGAQSFHRAWVEVSVITSPEAAEAVGAIMADLRTQGLVEDQVSPSRVRLRCYLPRSRTLPALIRTLRASVHSLARFGLDPRPALVRSRLVAARRWATAWRAWVHPVRVGSLLITPSWIPAPPGHRTVIEIDPGMAFGTGMHPSTRLGLRGLIGYLGTLKKERPLTVIDVGTGSGILAIASARLRAGQVWAVDNDPVAVDAARANVRQNGVARRVRVSRGEGLRGIRVRADLILANIVAETIISLLPAVLRRLAPTGVFIGSGIVAPRLPELLRAAKAAGLRKMDVLREGEWRAVVLGSPGALAGVRATSARQPPRWRRPGKTQRRRGP